MNSWGYTPSPTLRPAKSPYALVRDAFGPNYNAFYATFSKYKENIENGKLLPRKERRDLLGFAEYAREILSGVGAAKKIKPRLFLDLGAAPGGMASALFETFGGDAAGGGSTPTDGDPALRGWGISLPASEGGFPVSLGQP